MRQALDKTLRTALESAVIKARDIAEQAARETIERLGVSEAAAPSYLDADEANLRVKLRAHGRSLGDSKIATGEQGVEHLVSEVAYEHWHRMLFARFLEQNNLLMFDAHTPLTLGECEELAVDEGARNGWEYAGQLAAKMLPQVFRNDSPVFGLSLALNHIRSLESLISQLDLATFQAQDALGWVYQFWQTKRKQQVNDSGVKIGADELSPVTQLFTEPYMVSFLLDNALGAWWAKRVLTQNDLTTASSEQDLRERAAIAGVPLEYLRFIKDESGQWQPAAGGFEQWPQHLSELKTLDPCCGSGHFLVAAFLMLVPMRMKDEGLDAKTAIDKVIQQNIHGLELDQRCIELAAFALALEAWRYPAANGKAIGYRQLPELQLACTGLSVKAAKAEWKQLGVKLADESGKKNIGIALDWMHQTFADAPVLGSLINPKKTDAAKIVEWDELSEALNQALATDSDDAHEAQISAKGLAKAATLLAGEFSWVITNVPYLGKGKQSLMLQRYCELEYPDAKSDLSTVFLDRCMELCAPGGMASVVLTQNWLFLTTYIDFRVRLLKTYRWDIVARLGGGAEAFDCGPGNITNICMISMNRQNVSKFEGLLKEEGDDNIFCGIDVCAQKNVEDKSCELINSDLKRVSQQNQLKNPDCAVVLDETIVTNFFGNFQNCYQGTSSGDNPRYVYFHWEQCQPLDIFEYFESVPDGYHFYSGKQSIIKWNETQSSETSAVRGWSAFSKKGVIIGQMSRLPASLYMGYRFPNTSPVIVPIDGADYAPIWTLCYSPNFSEELRKVNQKLSVDNGYVGKIPYDNLYWSMEAERDYPNRLPQPYSNDPTQWIFHGHPCGSVIWHEQDKITAIGELRKDDTVLQVALARLLGYRWPTELDSEMELAPEQRQWVEACEPLLALMDDDGIACLPAVRGEPAAADRLAHMLEAAYGDAWNINVQTELLDAVGSKSLEAWLRDKFFAQHCKLFQNRPFIWQIWDGLKDGFSALVNYHQLDHDNLDRLIYTYLGDWIRTQEHGVKSGVDGADIRLAAAQNLKRELEAIKEGEASADGKSGYDIFIRWKPIEQQPIGWQPDLNDGVRLNIRPFMTAKDMGKKGAGLLRAKPNIHWKKDRGNDVESAPWYTLGEQYGEKAGARINDHHLTLAEKKEARKVAKDVKEATAALV